MKTRVEIEEAHQLLAETAKRASRDDDHESYEVAANLASGLAWCLGRKGPLTASIDDLLKLAKLERRHDPVATVDPDCGEEDDTAEFGTVAG